MTVAFVLNEFWKSISNRLRIQFYPNHISTSYVGMPEIVKLSAGQLSSNVATAAKILSSGGVIALPTDTLYGLAALTQNAAAVKEIYRVKQRNPLKPLAVCVANIEEIYKWAKVTVPKNLLHDLLPGPVTLIFSRTSALNKELNPDTNLVGIRIPDSKFIRSVSEQCKSPLALTSANISCQKSPLEVEEFKDIWNELSCIFDGGNICDTWKEKRLETDLAIDTDLVRQGSTIVDLSQKNCYKIVREGIALNNTISVLHRYNLHAIQH